jgi:DNA-binding GntR family transcriptional regulator
MYKIDAPTQLIEQVYDAILNAICSGALPPNEKITQEGLAETLGVSRQPILQAFQLLKRQGFIEESGRKGVMVTAIDPLRLLQLYQVRSVMDGLAARETAVRWAQQARQAKEDAADDAGLGPAQGRALIVDGRAAANAEDLNHRILADMNFHQFIYRASGNPVIAETTAIHWHHIRRAMGAILSNDVRSHSAVWDEHEAILDAIIAGKAALADKLAREHAESAADHLAKVLMQQQYASKRRQA